MKNLARLRRKKGLTQGQLALELGVELNTVWKWEHEKITPSVESAKRAARFFNVSVDELLNGPQKKEFRVNIVWIEEGDEDVENLAIKADDFNVGIKSDGSLLLWGEIPPNMPAREVGEKVRTEVEIAEEMRALREKRLHGGKE